VDIVVLANLDIDLGRLLRRGHFDKVDNDFEKFYPDRFNLLKIRNEAVDVFLHQI
jgi:hypothetical protein